MASSVVRWLAGMPKINVDATVSNNSGRSASAAMARDERGNFLGALALVVEGNNDAKVVEGIACREGLASEYANMVRSV